MKNMFKYYLKKRLPLFTIILGISLIITIVFIFSFNFIREYQITDGTRVKTINSTGMIYLTTILLILCIFYPIYEFSFKMKRTSCDLFYSLPIKRNRLFITKYLLGLGQILLIFLINFIIIMITGIIVFSNKDFYNSSLKEMYNFNAGYYFMYFGIMLILSTLLYSWNTFFFTRCNTIVDGVINMFISSIVLASAIFGVVTFLSKINGIDSSIFKSIYPMDYANFVSLYGLTIQIEDLASSGKFYLSIVSIIITWTLCAIALVLFIILSKNEKAEDTGDVSNSYFSYKVFIPIFIISLLMSSTNLVFIAIIIGGYIGYVIFNKNFKLKKNDWIAYAISVGVGIIFMIVGSIL